MKQSTVRAAPGCAARALVICLLSPSAMAQIQQTPEVIVSATRFEQTAERLAINASVITAEDISRSAARTLPELLGTRAGVVSRDLFGNNAALASVDMRGFGATAAQNTLILVDGQRLNDIDLSGVQWSSIPLDAIERIEILRGSGAVQYGDGASAGVINIITRHPARGGNRASVRARYASWDTRELSGSVNVFGESVGLYAHARNFVSDGYRDNNHNRGTNLGVRATWSGDRADATVRIAADRQGLRLPGARLVQPSAGINQLTSDRRGTSTPLDYAQRNGNQAAADLRWQLGAGEFVLGLGYRDKDQRSYFDFGGFPDYRDIALDVLTLQPRYRWQGKVFGADHAAVLGIDVARWDYRLLRSNSAGNVGRPFNTIDATQDNDAIYALDTIALTEQVSLNVGARAERMRISASDRFDATAPGGAFGSGAPAASDRRYGHAYEAGLRIGVVPDAALIVRTARSFRFANVDEIYEPSAGFTQEFQFLRPQKATTYELGIAFGSKLPWLQASAFRMDVDDEIRLDPFSTGIGNRNMPPLRRTGFELEAHHALGSSLQISGSYTYMRARFRTGVLPGSVFTSTEVDLAGRTVPLVPKHKLDLALDWRIGAGTRLRAETAYVSAQHMENDEGNTFGRRIPAYTVADLKLEHRMGAWAASAGIANLFDRKYYAYAIRSQFVADRFNAYPLPERSFWIALEYTGL
ncbi:MAG: TonB-dependent receptor [Burkholderiales bacterium]|nr:TonB-dependent receptor [Burkholderiales bacterium]